MYTDHRPLSPHLQVYRLPLTAVLSIIHRIAGVLLSLGNVALVVWLLAIVAGGSTYESLYMWFASIPGQIILIMWSAMLYFHLCNGIRHLVWDVGRGFELRIVDISAVAALFFTVILTALTWWFALGISA